MPASCTEPLRPPPAGWAAGYTWQRADESLFPLPEGAAPAPPNPAQNSAEADLAAALAGAGGGAAEGGAA